MVKDNIFHGCNVAPPNVISWFITLSNYSYNNHKSQWLWFETNLAILWGPTSGNGSFIPTALEGGDLKNVTYILNMVKTQVLEILQLPPPPARTGPI